MVTYDWEDLCFVEILLSLCMGISDEITVVTILEIKATIALSFQSCLTVLVTQ